MKLIDKSITALLMKVFLFAVLSFISFLLGRKLHLFLLIWGIAYSILGGAALYGLVAFLKIYGEDIKERKKKIAEKKIQKEIKARKRLQRKEEK